MGCCYPHLSLEERRKIAKWFEAKMPAVEMADRLGRAPSTVTRELKRNRYVDSELSQLNGYHAVIAQDLYERRRSVRRKMITHPKLKAAIEDRLKAGWSPEQIAGRLRLEAQPVTVSHETIYAYVYSAECRSQALARYLPDRRLRRRPRHARRPRGLIFPADRAIQNRPAHVAARTVFGDWEGDLMIFARAHQLRLRRL